MHKGCDACTLFKNSLALAAPVHKHTPEHNECCRRREDEQPLNPSRIKCSMSRLLLRRQSSYEAELHLPRSWRFGIKLPPRWGALCRELANVAMGGLSTAIQEASAHASEQSKEQNPCGGEEGINGACTLGRRLLLCALDKVCFGRCRRRACRGGWRRWGPRRHLHTTIALVRCIVVARSARTI